MDVNLNTYNAIGDGELHSVTEWLVGGGFDKGYENLREIQEDYPHVESLEDSIDWVIVQQAFNDLENKGQIIFEEGKTYVFNRVVVVEDKSFDAIMQGATVKMADASLYNAFRITTKDTDQIEYVNWTGGTFDGNKDGIDWPGFQGPDSDFFGYSQSDVTKGSLEDINAWKYDDEVANNTAKLWGQNSEYGNNGLLGIQNTSVVVIDGITIKDSISDGVVLFNVSHGTIQNSQAFGGVPFNFGAVLDEYGRGVQSTYFKGRQVSGEDYDGGTLILDNVHTTGGSIAYQLSAPPDLGAPGDSRFVVINSSSHNASQNAIHVEHSRYVEILDSNFTQDSSDYKNAIVIGNQTEYALIENVTVVGSVIDFREASSLVYGEVVNSEVYNSLDNTEYGIKNATLVSGTTVEISSGTAVHAKSVVNSHILGFDEYGIIGAEYIENVVIDNSLNGSVGTALQNFKGNVIIESEISNVDFGVSLKEGNVEIIDTSFVDIGTNALRVVDLDSLRLESVTFSNFGVNADSINETYAVYARNYWGSDIILISEDTVFLSNNGYLAFSESKGLQDIEYYISEDGDSTLEQLNILMERFTEVEYVQGLGEGETLRGKNGDDVILGAGGDDYISGGANNDFLMGEQGDDLVEGGKGRDILIGGEGNDGLFGGDGADILYGEKGDDILSGGNHGDHLFGGQGSDTFVFDSSIVIKPDLVKDFKISENDRIDLGMIFDNFDDISYKVDEFIKITGEGDFSLWVDKDGGSSEGNFIKLAIFENTEETVLLETLLENDSLIFG